MVQSWVSLSLAVQADSSTVLSDVLPVAVRHLYCSPDPGVAAWCHSKAVMSAGTFGAPRPVTLSYPGTERREVSTFSMTLPLPFA
jgi:hypothetical protein